MVDTFFQSGLANCHEKRHFADAQETSGRASGPPEQRYGKELPPWREVPRLSDQTIFHIRQDGLAVQDVAVGRFGQRAAHGPEANGLTVHGSP